MLRINPALIIGSGACAEKILDRVEEMILMQHYLDSIPPVLQFVLLPDLPSSMEEVTHAYSRAISKYSSLETEDMARVSVDATRVESFVIVPLQVSYLKTAINVAAELTKCAVNTIAGGRNAIFLVPRKLLSLDTELLQVAANSLDSAMRSTKFPFSRCFFIDEVDESGHVILEDELIELVARFLSLAVISELTDAIKTTPPPYFGDGPHFRGYASFSCSTIGFDSQSLIDLLSGHLARDISDYIFTSGKPALTEAECWKRAEEWFKDSLNHPLSDSSGVSLADISQDPDYINAQERLNKFTRGVYELFSFDMNSYQYFLDKCLECGIVQLESLLDKMKLTKKKINELDIKIMLGLSCGEHVGEIERESYQRPWVWIIVLTIIGVIVIAAPSLSSSRESESAFNTISLVVGSVLITVAVLLIWLGKKRVNETESIVNPISCHEELEKKKREYEKQNKLLNIHLALYACLDLGYANLENLRNKTVEPFSRSHKSVFDLDLIDEEMAQKLYAQEFKSKGDLEWFINLINIGTFHSYIFSFFSLKLVNLLRQYCADRLEDIRQYDLEKVFQMRESLNGHKKLKTHSSPFWHPLNPLAEEKVVLAAIHEQTHESMYQFLKNTFGTHVRFVPGQNSKHTTVIQFAYGLDLSEFLAHTQPSSYESEPGKSHHRTESATQSRLRATKALPEPPLTLKVGDDGEMESKLIKRLQDGIIAGIQEMIAGPVLENYDGYACMTISTNNETLSAPTENHLASVSAGKSYDLKVWLQPQEPEALFAQSIHIPDGKDVDSVNFEIVLDSDSVKFKTRREFVDAKINQTSKILRFSFVAPERPGAHKIWLKLLQKNRLVQIIQATVEVKTEGGE